VTRYRTLLLAAALLAVSPNVPGVRGTAEGQVHQCNFCHNVHGGAADRNLTRDSRTEDLCLTCHSDAGPGYLVGPDPVTDTVKSTLIQVAVHAGAKHTVGDTTSCWDCHDHEAEAVGATFTNLFMIPVIRTLPGGGQDSIVFTADTAQADFIGTNGVCYVCHTQPTTQANGLNGHNGPMVCTACHTHVSGFQGVGGGCTTCHAETKGIHRPVVPEFDRASHHIQLGGAAADIPDADCMVCHNQDGHPRAGTNHVVLINQDDGSLITYDRGVSATSVLTPFCLSCHDADGGAGGDTSPFSDNIIRPEINETAWNVSSHQGSSSAQCADCHEGHGSEKKKLLTPGDTVPDPTTKVQEEEGFCLDCHVAGVPAGSNLAAGWSTTTFWQNDFTQNGALLNDRHDIAHADQVQSGAKVECVNCHDPHTASRVGGALSKLRADPDPNDGRVPGSGWFGAAAGAGQGTNAMTEWCLDCHDNSFPATVTAPTLPLIDLRTSYLNVEQHGAQSAGSPVGGAPGWGAMGTNFVVPCQACHQPHPQNSQQLTNPAAYNNLFQLRDMPLDSDLTTPLASTAGSPYEVTSLTTRKYTIGNGYNWCNTCHSGSMGDQQLTCFACHTHGDGRF